MPSQVLNLQEMETIYPHGGNLSLWRKLGLFGIPRVPGTLFQQTRLKTCSCLQTVPIAASYVVLHKSLLTQFMGQRIDTEHGELREKGPPTKRLIYDMKEILWFYTQPYMHTYTTYTTKASYNNYFLNDMYFYISYSILFYFIL